MMYADYNDLVPVHIAKLAAEKGFNYPCKYFCYDTENHLTICENKDIPEQENANTIIKVPERAKLQKWLRDKFNYFVVIIPEAYINGINWNVQLLVYDNTCIDCWGDNSSGMFGDNGEFKTYEEALDFGLQLALKRI